MSALESPAYDPAALLGMARNLDREGRLAEAACAYEALMRASDPDVEVYLNLIGLFFCAMDPREAAHYRVGDDFRKLARLRFDELVELVLERWPHSVEGWFWRKYADRLFGDGPVFARELAERLTKSKELVPYAYLALAGAAGPYGQQMQALRVLGNVQLTARMRYALHLLGR